MEESSLNWLNQPITLQPAEGPSAENEFRNEKLKNISEQIQTVQYMSQEVYQLSGMTTQRLKHLSTRVKENLDGFNQTTIKDITVYTMVALHTTLFAILVSLGFIKYKSAMLELKSLKERMMQHEQLGIEEPEGSVV